MTKKKKPSRLTKALLETADDMRRVGLLGSASQERTTRRHLGGQADIVGKPISGDEIRSLRERAHLSQAVFARYLNLTVGYVSQLERGAKRPTGPALVLLNVIRRKGIEAILWKETLLEDCWQCVNSFLPKGRRAGGQGRKFGGWPVGRTRGRASGVPFFARPV